MYEISVELAASCLQGFAGFQAEHVAGAGEAAVGRRTGRRCGGAAALRRIVAAGDYQVGSSQ